MNAALAMIEAAAPKDEIEGALAVQMLRLCQREGDSELRR
jgi:hypothetical protein